MWHATGHDLPKFGHSFQNEQSKPSYCHIYRNCCRKLPWKMEKSNDALIIKVDKFRTKVHQIWRKKKEKYPYKTHSDWLRKKSWNNIHNSQFKLCCRTRIGKPGTLGTKIDHRYVHLSDRQARECFLKCLENDVFLRGSTFSNTFCEATTKVFFLTFLHYISCPPIILFAL